MLVSMILFWGLVIAAVVWVVRAPSRATVDRRPETRTPEEILAERFARGEIDEPEYHDRLAALRGVRQELAGR